MNPRTVQRTARHRDIKTTLIYDHSTDKDVLDYLKNQEEIKYGDLPVKAKAQVLLEKLFNGDIDISTFNAGLELLRPGKKHMEDVVGYA